MHLPDLHDAPVRSDSLRCLDGAYSLLGDAPVSVLDRGFILGDGVYERIPVYGDRLSRDQPAVGHAGTQGLPGPVDARLLAGYQGTQEALSI